MPLKEGKIGVEDRGFQFADGIYGTIRVYNGVPFHFNEHLKRIERSAKGILLALPYSLERIDAICRNVIKRSDVKWGKLYIQVTRGEAPRKHVFPQKTKPTFLAYVSPMKPHHEDCYKKGIKVITVPDERWSRPYIKSVCLLPNVLAAEKARRAGAYEAIQYDEKGVVTEGSATNAYMIKRGVLYTYPAQKTILRGITRMLALKMAKRIGLPVKERKKTVNDFKNADEVFVSGSTVEVMPVVKIERATISNGKPGPWTKKLRIAFYEEVVKECGAYQGYVES